MIQIYSAENKDYDHNGDMTLLPEECSVHVVLNGEWTATLEHPIDDEGRYIYKCIMDGDDFTVQQIKKEFDYRRVANAYMAMDGEE